MMDFTGLSEMVGDLGPLGAILMFVLWQMFRDRRNGKRNRACPVDAADIKRSITRTEQNMESTKDAMKDMTRELRRSNETLMRIEICLKGRQP